MDGFSDDGGPTAGWQTVQVLNEVVLSTVAKANGEPPIGHQATSWS